MNYKYTRVTTPGRIGTIKTYEKKVDETGAAIDTTFELGHIGETFYLYAPDDFEPAEQDPGIEFQAVEMTTELAAQLKLDDYTVGLKDALRGEIYKIAGDPLDLIADLYKIIEPVTMLTVRNYLDRMGEVSLTDTQKASYTALCKTLVTAVDSGKLPLFDEVENSLSSVLKVMTRLAAMQPLVKAYKEQLAAVGLSTVTTTVSSEKTETSETTDASADETVTD